MMKNNETWQPEITQGPLCAYWDVEDAVICGHGSCYRIAEESDYS